MKTKTLVFVGLAAVSWFAWRYRSGEGLTGRLALITGGSRGLGLELARILGRQGVKLALLARDHDELDRAAAELSASGCVVATCQWDLLDTGRLDELIAQIETTFGQPVDILINNAGEIVTAPFETLSAGDFQHAMNLHLHAPLALIKAVLPSMKRRGGGNIVNISSIGGKVPVPHLSSYCASKFALTGLSGALRAELAKDGIIVTTVCPGLMRTGSHWNARFKGDVAAEFAWFAHSAASPLTSIDSSRAAEQIVAAFRRGEAELVISVQARLAVLMHGLFPSLFQNTAALVDAVLLPGADGHSMSDSSVPGWQAGSPLVPSPITRAGDIAAVENNEI